MDIQIRNTLTRLLGVSAWYIFFSFVFFIAIFDPQNNLGIRYYLIGVLVIPYILFFFKAIRNIDVFFIIIQFAYLIPLWGVIVFFFRGNIQGAITDTSYISFSIAFSLVFFLANERRFKLFKNVSLLFGVLFSCLILFTGIEVLSGNGTSLYDFALTLDIARITLRDYGGVSVPYIYYFASPILLIPLSILVTSRKSLFNTILFLLITTALFLSGTRSHNVLAIFFSILFLKQWLNGKSFYILFSILFLVLIGFYLDSFIGIIDGLFSLREDNNSYKFSMLSKYLSIFSDPITLLFGQGFQAIDWNTDLASMVAESATKTELTFLELVRVFGFLFSGVIVLSLIYFFSKSSKLIHNTKSLLLLSLLFDALLNPHLFSTYGAIICAFVFSVQED